MAKKAVTILGGGNTAFAVAARFTLTGLDVTLCELPEFDESIAPIRESRTIRLIGVAEEGAAQVQTVTTDVGEALAASDLALVIVPAYAHRPFAEACAPHLRAGQTIVLMPGTLGTLEWSRILRGAGVIGVTLAEVDTAPYVCRKTGPAEATIWGVVPRLGLGVLPSERTGQVRDLLEPLFPGIEPHSDTMACGLSSINPVVHPAGVLMNAGRVEYSRGDFYFYEEGVTPAVAEVISRVDRERRAIGKSLGYDLVPVNEAFHEAGFGPSGDLWATINGSRMLTALRAPGTLQHRWLTEDIPYGLATWSLIAQQFGIDTPLMHAFVDIGSIVMGLDGWKHARTPADLGIDQMDSDKLKTFLRTG